VERTSDTGNPNNGGDDNDQTAPLGRGPTAGGGDSDGYNSSSSSGSSISGSSVHSHRSIRKPKKIKKIKKRTDHGKTPEQQQWETMTGIVILETSSKMSKLMKGIKIDAPENINSRDKKWSSAKKKLCPDPGVRLVPHVHQVNPTASCRVPHASHVPYIVQCVSNHGVRQVHQVPEKIFCAIM